MAAGAKRGATLLQGLLNAIDGHRVHGENGGFFANLQDAHEALADAYAHLPIPVHDPPGRPWFGASFGAPGWAKAARERATSRRGLSPSV